MKNRKYTIETEQETDGRWFAEVLEMPGVMTYGKTPEEAQAHVEALALRVLADELESQKVRAKELVSFSKILFSLS